MLEIAGPRAENLVDMAALLITRRGDPLRVEAVSDPADPDRALYESGALLPGSIPFLRTCPTPSANNRFAGINR